MSDSVSSPAPDISHGGTLERDAAAPGQMLDMLSVFAAGVAERGNQPVAFYFDTTLTYEQLDRFSDKIALWLQDAGVMRGDRVAIVLQNMPQFLMMIIATWKVGAIPMPANPMYKRGELARIFADCTPKALLCLDTVWEEVDAALEQAGLNPAKLVTGALSFQSRNDPRVLPPAMDPIVGSELLEDVIDRGSSGRPPRLAIDGEECGLLLYTSGTTGHPKGAMIRHRSLATQGEAMRRFCALATDSRILAVAPFFHITGISCHVAAALSARAALILHYRVEPSLLLDVIKEHRPTFTIGAITAFNALMNVPGIERHDMRSFDRIYSGGAPIPPTLIAEFEARLGVGIHSSYGMTETTAHTHLAPFGIPIPVDPTSGALSIGKLTPGTRAKVVDDNGVALGPHKPGELLIDGPQIMAGYWKKPEETAFTLREGWMHTGDVAFYDKDGWFYLVDRIKDVIIASGFKVWPREVEDVLYAHEAIREAAVVGAPDEYRGETVHAFVSLKPGAQVDPAVLIDHCRQRLAAYKVPRQVTIIDELPKTATGKIQRLALRGPSGRQETGAKGSND